MSEVKEAAVPVNGQRKGERLGEELFAKAKGKGKGQDRHVTISRPRYERAAIMIEGTSPYVQNAFSKKALNMMAERQRQGDKAKSKRKREERDFDEDYKNAMHVTADGRAGIPAPCIRNAM